MGAVPTTTDQTAKTVDTIINDSMMKIALKAAETTLESAVPELDLPIVKQFFELGMGVAFAAADKAMEQGAAFMVMDAQANAEAASYQNAVAALHTAVNAGDPNAISQASAAFDTTLGNLIHFDGS
jgi:hypothetical protein